MLKFVYVDNFDILSIINMVALSIIMTFFPIFLIMKAKPTISHCNLKTWAPMNCRNSTKLGQ